MIGSDRQRLAQELRNLRAASAPSGSAFARGLGWQQSRVSKIETGTQLPTEQDIQDWSTAAGAPGSVPLLLELLERARVEYASHRAQFATHGGAARNQVSIREREQQASEIVSFQPAMVPGLLQTAPYARELLSLPCGPTAWGASAEDIEQTVARRIERQEILYDPEKRLRFVVGEAALWTKFGAVDTLLGQLDRLVAVAGLASVDFGVVPFSAPMPVFPLGGFKVHDEELVIVESLAGEQLLADPDAVKRYHEWAGQLWSAAATGEGAVSLIRSVAGRLR
jgi:transcriptional regulator with XRE-family HTH domain